MLPWPLRARGSSLIPLLNSAMTSPVNGLAGLPPSRRERGARDFVAAGDSREFENCRRDVPERDDSPDAQAPRYGRRVPDKQGHVQHGRYRLFPCTGNPCSPNCSP